MTVNGLSLSDRVKSHLEALELPQIEGYIDYGFRWTRCVIAKTNLDRVERNFQFLTSIDGIPYLSSYVDMEVHGVCGQPSLVEVRLAQSSYAEICSGPIAEPVVCMQIVTAIVTLEMSYKIPGIFSPDTAISCAGHKVLLINWGNLFLFGDTSGKANNVDFIANTIAIRMDNDTGSRPIDMLAYICGNYMNGKSANVYSPEYVPSLLNDKMSKRDLYRWVKETASHETLNTANNVYIPGGCLDTSNALWQTHIRIRNALQYGSVPKLLREISPDFRGTLRIPSPDRLDVYCHILGVDWEVVGGTPFASEFDHVVAGFARITGECSRNPKLHALSQRFKNRVLREDSIELVKQFLRMIDEPLFDRIRSIENGFAIVDALMVQSLGACWLSNSDLTLLWDSLLLASPEMLVRVVGVALMEARDLFLDCHSKSELVNGIHCMHALINFETNVLQVAINSSDSIPL